MLKPVLNVLVDCGGNRCESVTNNLWKFPVNFQKIYVFEPNPSFHQGYEGSGYTLIRKAVWTSETTLPFYLSRDTRRAASSLYPEVPVAYRMPAIHPEEPPLMVETVDLSAWLRSIVSPSRSVTLKLDIEGAEYAVLPKLIKDGTVGLVKELYVEFHRTAPTRSVHDRIVNDLESLGVPLHTWD